MDQQQERLITIITPCREVELPMVEKLLDSLKKQTFGFEKLEWILVVHNSGSDYLHQVEELVAPYANIRLYKLKNEFHTPSSPKNYAMGKARCPYITFLDADDTLTENCLEVALPYFTDDIDGVFFKLASIVKANEKRLNIALDAPDDEEEIQYLDCRNLPTEYMQGCELTVTAKIYRRSVLEEHQIRFDVDVPIAEDVFFNLHFMKYGRNICLLRKFEGYNYTLRDDSALQDFAGKTPEAVMFSGNGFAKILEYGIGNGLFMDNILLDLLAYQSSMMLACITLSLEQRKKLKVRLEPLIVRLKNVNPTAHYDAKLLKTIKVLPKIVIMRPHLMQAVSAVLRALHVDMNQKIRSMHPAEG